MDVGEIPLGFEELVKMSFEFTGTLGLKGPSVDAYSFHDDGRKGEPGSQGRKFFAITQNTFYLATYRRKLRAQSVTEIYSIGLGNKVLVFIDVFQFKALI